MKTVRHNVSHDIAHYMSLLTAPHGLVVEPSFSSFTERIVDLLEAKYPVISREIFAEAVDSTRVACARVALLEGTAKLDEYQTHEAPQTALGPVQDTRDRIVKAILAGAEAK